VAFGGLRLRGLACGMDISYFVLRDKRSTSTAMVDESVGESDNGCRKKLQPEKLRKGTGVPGLGSRGGKGAKNSPQRRHFLPLPGK
jgi:hypothetical protein